MTRKAPGTANQGLFPKLGFGLGLRSEHYSEVLKGRHSISWFEVVTENYLGDGGRPLLVLEKVRAEKPVVFHGVSLSIGSTDPLDEDYLARVKRLADRFEPAMISDHACWTGVGGQNLHDLLPLPYTAETVRHVADRVKRVQDVLKRRILLENVSSYLTYAHSEMEEWEFLSEISERADCGLLLDINNIYVSAVNHGFRPERFLDGVPAHRIGQFHLAGHSTNTTDEGKLYLIDTHDHPVCPEVWDLYSKAVARFGAGNTMIERDANIPEFQALADELQTARDIAKKIHEDTSPELRHPVPAGRPSGPRRRDDARLPLSTD